MTDDDIKAMARKAGEGETGRRLFAADLSWLLAFARMVEATERERCAAMLDAAHEQRKHLDNYAAFYARMIREARLIEGPNVNSATPPAA